MLRRDYFIRKLEEFSKALAAILLSKRSHDWEKFEAETRDAIQKFTALDLKTVEDMDDATFDTGILHNDKLEAEDKKILAAILFEKLDFYAQGGQQEQYNRCAQRCLRLYDYLYANQTENEFDLEVHYRLNMLRELVR